MTTIKRTGIDTVGDGISENKHNLLCGLKWQQRIQPFFNLSYLIKAGEFRDRHLSLGVKVGGTLIAITVATATLNALVAISTTSDRLKDLHFYRTRELAELALSEVKSPTPPLELRERAIAQATLSIVLSTVASIALQISIIMLLLNKTVLQRLKKLQNAAQRVAAGDMTVYLTSGDRRLGRDEVINLACSFDQMLDTLRNRTHQALSRAQAAEAAALKLEKEVCEKSRVEIALRESQERYALAVSAANEGLWDWNLSLNTVYFSDRWKSMLGYEEREIGNNPDEWLNRIHPEDIEQVKAEIDARLRGMSANFECEYRIMHSNGSYRWMRSRAIAVPDQNETIYRMVGSMSDITECKITQTQLFHNAFHDPLTGLSNRAFFTNRLEHAIELTKRWQNYSFAVLFLDLDRFKTINDTFGHQSGDKLLVDFVQRLKTCLRSVDTVARLGGDEFAVLLEGIAAIGDATIIADRIHQKMASPFNLNGQEVFTSASIGIALSGSENNSPKEILRNADLAMYRAKSLAKGTTKIFEPAMQFEATKTLQMEKDLRRAIKTIKPEKIEGENKETCQFLIYYQPIVSLRSGTIQGFEALLRWQHPTRNTVSPAEFMAIAEETRLIIPLGYWVLREACRQMSLWQQQFSTSLALAINVNLSGQQFFQADLIEEIVRILEETGMTAQNLKLEITEKVIMENPDTAADILMRLRRLGVGLYIDDFGTGYSSLSFMHRFPLDGLKIDRSFINKMDSSGESWEIVRTIVKLAHNLGIGVVAEGVETSQQLEQLNLMGCENGQGQGYLFSKPLNSLYAEKLIVKTFQEGQKWWREADSYIQDQEFVQEEVMTA